jgi:hypothetical protein
MHKTEIDTKMDDHFHSIIDDLYDNDLHRRSKTCKGDDSLIFTIKVCNKDKLNGRIAIYHNPVLSRSNNTWVLGQYEAINDDKVVNLIFDKIEKLAKLYNVTTLIGPMNGSTWFNYRLPQSSNQLFFTEEASKDYYKEHFNKVGFSPIASYFSAKDTGINYTLGIDDLIEKFYKKGLTIRNINLDDFENELTRLYLLISESFKKNKFYSPIAYQVFLNKYLSLKSIINPNYFLIAEDENKNIIGFFMCLHDFYNQKEKTLIAKTIARSPLKEWAGLGSVLSESIMIRAKKDGYQSIIHAFMQDENHSTNLSNKTTHNIINKYHLYEKSLK